MNSFPAISATTSGAEQLLEERIREAVRRKVESDHPAGIIVAIPMRVRNDFKAELLGLPGVTGLILAEQGGDVIQDDRIGHFILAKYIWVFPTCKVETVIYTGPADSIGLRMAAIALRHGCREIMYMDHDEWKSGGMAGFIFGRINERLMDLLLRRFDWMLSWLRQFIKTSIAWTASMLAGMSLIDDKDEFIQRINWRMLLIARRLEDLNILSRSSYPFQELLTSPDVPLLTAGQFERGRILLVNSALAWGGAERQVVNTLIGLKESGFQDVSLLCERLGEFKDSDFYLWKLADVGVEVSSMTRFAHAGGLSLRQYQHLYQLLNRLSPHIRQTIVSYIFEFYQRRPEVVHLWQDATSVLAGIAAAIVGVPRIVLCTRNMAPYRFPYYMSYMKPGYLALLSLPCVRFINNSHAGRKDYAGWLDIPEDRFSVLLNGLDKSDVPDVPLEESTAYRLKTGISDEATVIGSIFRFYGEKDPLLWINTAAEIVRRAPQLKTVFLLIGTGPMKQMMLDHAGQLGIADRLYMPGTEKHPVLPLSVMDIFLLTSLNEGTPNVVIEAQMSGVPVIATDAGGTRDTIKQGITGWVLETRNPADLADRVVQSLNDRVWLENARNCATEFAHASFGIERMIADTLVIYGYDKK